MIRMEFTYKCWYFSDKLIDGVDFVLTCLDDILTILFVLGMCFTILFNSGLYFLDNLLGLFDGFLQAGMLRLDFDADLHVVIGLFDLVLYVEDDSSSLLFVRFCVSR